MVLETLDLRFWGQRLEIGVGNFEGKEIKPRFQFPLSGPSFYQILASKKVNDDIDRVN